MEILTGYTKLLKKETFTSNYDVLLDCRSSEVIQLQSYLLFFSIKVLMKKREVSTTFN